MNVCQNQWWIWIAVIFVAACGGKEDPVEPYRGTWVANVTLSEQLQQRLVEDKGYKPESNCIQMITRDKTEDGVRKSQKLLLFSPEACPAGEEVAKRESFAIQFTRNENFNDSTLPALAYYLMEDRAVVGTIDMTKQAVNEGDKQEFQVSDLCTIQRFYSQNCTLDIDPNNGTFQQMVMRQAVGEMLREQEFQSRFFDRLDRMQSALGTAINASDRQMFERVSNLLMSVEKRISTEQWAAAVVTWQFTFEGFNHLERNLNGNHNATYAALSRAFRAQLHELRRDIMQHITEQFEDQTQQIEDWVCELSGHIDNATDEIVDTVKTRIDQLQERLIQEQWDAAWATAEFLWFALDDLYIALDGRLEERHRRLLQDFMRKVNEFGQQVQKAIREELKRRLERLNSRLGTVQQNLRQRIATLQRTLVQGRNRRLSGLMQQIRQLIATSRNTELRQIEQLLTRHRTAVLSELQRELRTLGVSIGQIQADQRNQEFSAIQTFANALQREMLSQMIASRQTGAQEETQVARIQQLLNGHNALVTHRMTSLMVDITVHLDATTSPHLEDLRGLITQGRARNGFKNNRAQVLAELNQVIARPRNLPQSIQDNLIILRDMITEYAEVATDAHQLVLNMAQLRIALGSGNAVSVRPDRNEVATIAAIKLKIGQIAQARLNDNAVDFRNACSEMRTLLTGRDYRVFMRDIVTNRARIQTIRRFVNRVNRLVRTLGS